MPRDKTILLGHGSGGKLTHRLLERTILPHFRHPALKGLPDAATLPATEQIAFTTDAYVVHPIEFPGGNIGRLAVCGTVNDLAVSGAEPQFLSCALIAEEGLETAVLERVLTAMEKAAEEAGVSVVTGDTKVVERGKGDDLFVITAGVGLFRRPVALAPERIQPGDAILLSGTIGDHGIAVLAAREGLTFGTSFDQTDLRSDTAPITPLVQAALNVAGDGVRFFRDPTRGGVATVLKELAVQTQLNFWIDEARIPIAPAVAAACEMLGFDPLYIANEGKVLAVVDAAATEAVLRAWQALPLGQNAAQIGEVRPAPAGEVHCATAIGGTRIVDMLAGEQLPRIC